MSDASQAEMPRYQCHKQVHALKIAAMEFDREGRAAITPADAGYARFWTGSNFRSKVHDTPDSDLGYYVVYQDGYASWSPSKAFEEGYTRI
jgi:hypothetical protein